MGVTRTTLDPAKGDGSREFIERLTAERLDEARESLKQRFLVLAPRRVAAMQAAVGAAVGDGVARRELQRLGHQMRGTAATVGLPDLGLLGGLIEGLTAALPYTDEIHARVAGAVALTAEYVTRARDGSGGALGDDPRFEALAPGRR
jgi:HPt (histidine-containing phosphotransfer) domain-containing protein